MDPPIRIEGLEAGDAADLVQAFAVRGLIGTAERKGAVQAVVIPHPHEETKRLLPDVVEALEGWLADRRKEAVELRVGAERLTVRARRLPDALRARVPDSNQDAQARF